MLRFSQKAKAVRERDQRFKRARAARFNEPLKEFVRIKYPSIYEEYEALYERLIADGSRKWKLMNTETFKRWKKSNEVPEETVIMVTATELTQPVNEEATIMVTATGLTQPVNETFIEVQNESTNLPLFVPQIRIEPCTPVKTTDSSRSEVPREENAILPTDLKETPDSISGFQHPNDIINTLLQEEGLQEYLKEYDEVVPVKDGDSLGAVELSEEPAIHPHDLYEDPDGMEEFQRVNNIINELIQEHEIQEHLRDCDEGIDIDPLAELALDIEPFDFDLEVEDLISYDY